MVITTITAVHNSVSLDYSALTRQEKEKLIEEVAKQPSVSHADIPPVSTGARKQIQDRPLPIRTIDSIAFTFENS